LEAHRLSITAAKESGSLAVSVHSPASHEPGISPGRLVTKDGEPFKIGERAYDKEACSGDGREKPNKLGWAVASVGTPTASNKVRIEHPKTMPTPVSSEVRQGVQVRRKGTKGKQESLTTVATSCEGSLNPDWVEWLMNWPIGWTSLEPIGDVFDDWLIATHLRIWHHVEPDIPRTAKNVPNRGARLKAIGNGQVPLAAYLAWVLLMARFDVDNAIPAVDHV
jgi:hypothetical protein